MKQAIIDIGSNSIRLTVYEINGEQFKTLFRAREMAGLAGYVEFGKLSREGIDVAKSVLLEFSEILKTLSIENVSVFATASLRNILNTEEAVEELQLASGFEVEVLRGEEEAFMSYQGAMMDLRIQDGAFIDIGGASTELVSFANTQPIATMSCRIGSLSLYKRCVGKILPGKKSLARMERVLKEELDKAGHFTFDTRSPLVCVGGTARAILKIASKVYDLPAGTRTLRVEQVDGILKMFLHNEKKTCKLILRMEPDRIHTIIPGLFILDRILHLYHSKEIVVSRYGVREGFLWKKIIQSQTATTSLPRIGN